MGLELLIQDVCVSSFVEIVILDETISGNDALKNDISINGKHDLN